MLRHIIAVVLPIIIFSSDLLAVEVTFESLKELVRSKNEMVKSHKLEAQAATEREGHLRRSYLPKVFLRAGFESFEVGSQIKDEDSFFGVETKLNVYNSGRDRLENKVQQLVAQRKQNQIKVVWVNELRHARELYWKIIYLKKEMKLNQDAQNMNLQNLKAANRQIRSGVATSVDRLEFEMKALDLKRDLRNTKAELKTLSNELVTLLGYDIEEPLTIKGGLLAIGKWRETLVHTHESHDFFTRGHELYAQELALRGRQYGRGWAPQVDVYASWNQFTLRQGDDILAGRARRESVVGVRLTMNILDQVFTRNETRALSAEKRAARALAAHKKKKNEAHVEEEFTELSLLESQLADAEVHIAKAEKYHKLVLRQYRLGAKSSPDVLGASERWVSVHRSRNQLLRDFHIARSHVLSKIGK